MRGVSALDHVRALLAEMDLRYQQRFDAQGQALTAALLAAEKAVQCVTIDTPVLCADLVWRPAGDLVVGDELIAFDEEAPPRTGGIASRGRLYRRAVVTGNTPRRTALLRVATPYGSVRCNREHPWLAKRRDRAARWRWVTAADLRPGDEVMRPLDVWDVDKSWEAGWLAGMLDGEGCLYFTKGTAKARLSAVQRVSETADRIDAALKARCDSHAARLRESPGRQPRIEFSIDVRADVMKILGSVRPGRLLVNADQVWEGQPIGGWHRSAVVTAVTDAARGTVASLSTSTGTYIAGGFAMHNTALIAAEKAVAKAETANEKRFESVNEFRKTLSDQTASFPSRVELQALADRVADLATRLDKAEGRGRGVSASVAMMMGLGGLVITIVGVVVAIYVASH